MIFPSKINKQSRNMIAFGNSSSTLSCDQLQPPAPKSAPAPAPTSGSAPEQEPASASSNSPSSRIFEFLNTQFLILSSAATTQKPQKQEVTKTLKTQKHPVTKIPRPILKLLQTDAYRFTEPITYLGYLCYYYLEIISDKWLDLWILFHQCYMFQHELEKKP